MRLGIKLLNCDGDVNKFKEVRTLDLRRGETATVYFALVDLATGNRFVPTSTSTVQITIPRSIIQQGTIGDQRQRLNPTITRAAVKPFSGDWSIWSFPLVSNDTCSMVSGGIQVNLTDTNVQPNTVLKAALDMAFKVHNGEDVS